MATPTNTHRPVGVAPNPWLGRMLVALAALVAAWAVVTLVDGRDSDRSGPQSAVQAETVTAAQAAATARLAGQAEAPTAAPAQAVAPAPAPSDIFDYRDLDLLAGVTTVTPAVRTPSDIFEYRQFAFIPGSGPATVDLRAYDLVSGDIPNIVPFNLAAYDLVWGDIPDIVPFAGGQPSPNPRQQMR